MKKYLFCLTAFAVWFASAAESQACPRTTYYRRSTVVVQQPKPVVNNTTVIVTKVPTPTVKNLLRVPQGSAMRIKVNFLGNEPGVVFLTAGKLTLQCQVTEWASTHVVFELPELGVLEPSEVRLDVAKADGRVARSVNVLLTPTADVEVIESAEIIPRAPRKVSVNRPTLNTGGLNVDLGN